MVNPISTHDLTHLSQVYRFVRTQRAWYSAGQVSADAALLKLANVKCN